MSVTTAPITDTTGTVSPARARRIVRARGVLLGGAASAGTWLLAAPFGVDFTITDAQSTGVIDLPTAAVFPLVVGLLGWATLAGLERITRYGTRIWTVLAWIVLAASMVPVFLVEATTGTRVALFLIHLAVGAVLIPTFTRR